MSDTDDYSRIHTCTVCLAELDSTFGPETCLCGAEYDKSGKRIWDDDPLLDLQSA